MDPRGNTLQRVGSLILNTHHLAEYLGLKYLIFKVQKYQLFLYSQDIPHQMIFSVCFRFMMAERRGDDLTLPLFLDSHTLSLIWMLWPRVRPTTVLWKIAQSHDFSVLHSSPADSFFPILILFLTVSNPWRLLRTCIGFHEMWSNIKEVYKIKLVLFSEKHRSYQLKFSVTTGHLS